MNTNEADESQQINLGTIPENNRRHTAKQPNTNAKSLSESRSVGLNESMNDERNRTFQHDPSPHNNSFTAANNH